VSEDSQHAIEYERSGSLHVAKNDAAAMELAIAARKFAHAGVAHQLMPGRDAVRLEPALSPRLISALLLPMHGYVRASELTTALAAAAVRRGAELITAPVEEICTRGSRRRGTNERRRHRERRCGPRSWKLEQPHRAAGTAGTAGSRTAAASAFQ
jgi:glycine/D-amino acid oxidase-like deaminating enzyme